MRLDELQATLRQRNAWEAIDLGVAMARQWWRPLAASWCAVVLPISALIAIGLHRRPWLAVLVLWWLKPLWGQVPRFVLSRALFGATPTVREVLTAKLWRRSIRELLWRRPDPLRAFLAPIVDLERLTGAAHRNRRSTLGRQGSMAALALTAIGLMLEVSVILGLSGLILLMLPEAPQYDAEVILDRILNGDPPSWLSAAMPGAYLVAISLVEPLVVAGGFGLYLNRRTRLEGWDIELVFRKLAQRLQHSAAVLLLVLTILPASAAAQPATPEAALEAVLQQPEFQPVLVEERWQYRHEWPPSWLEPSPQTKEVVPYLGETIRIIAYSLLAVGLLMLLVLVIRHAHLPSRRKTSPTLGKTVSGGALPAHADGQPTNRIAEHAWALWCDGQHPEALSLLYRGALSSLIETGLRIEEGATERECLRAVRASGIEAEKVATFSSLTQSWVRIAYAGSPPSSEQVSTLCAAWTQHFEGTQ